MKISLQKATIKDSAVIWQILKDAIKRRKEDGSNQWQDGYPNPETIALDIEKQIGFVLTDGKNILGYCAILINDEPEYENIKGKWQTNEDFVVFHRVAIHQDFLGKGLAQELFLKIEEFAIKNNVFSIRADTNFDNQAMLHLFKKLNYQYCGKVYFRGSERLAFEKVIDLN